MADPEKTKTVAQLLGEAYFTAFHTMQQNREGVEFIADQLMERREMHGDEVIDVLDRAGLQLPTLDYLDKTAWPKI